MAMTKTEIIAELHLLSIQHKHGAVSRPCERLALLADAVEALQVVEPEPPKPMTKAEIAGELRGWAGHSRWPPLSRLADAVEALPDPAPAPAVTLSPFEQRVRQEVANFRKYNRPVNSFGSALLGVHSKSYPLITSLICSVGTTKTVTGLSETDKSELLSRITSLSQTLWVVAEDMGLIDKKEVTDA